MILHHFKTFDLSTYIVYIYPQHRSTIPLKVQ